MKVYLVHETAKLEGCDLTRVNRVFDSERKALDYVIKNEYSGPSYSKMIPAWLDDNARGHIEEMEVE